MKTLSLRTACVLSLVAAASASALNAQALRLGFGTAVARFGDDVVVAESNNMVGPAALHLYRRSGGAWTEAASVTPEDWQPEDHFGSALGATDDALIASAPGQDDGRGAVYVYRRSGGGLDVVQRIAFPDVADGAAMGSALAVADGRLLVGGADGTVAAFVRQDGAWRPDGTLSTDDLAEGDRFGAALAVAGDVALVGAPGQAVTDVPGAGAVYVFERRDGAWTRTSKIALRGLSENDAFGTGVALNGPNEAFVGARNMRGSGQVFGFSREAEDAEWGVSLQLAPFAPSGTDRFGSTIQASDDEILVGGERSHGLSGAVYVFERDATGEVTSSHFLGREDGRRGTAFASAFAVAGDVAVVGAPGDDNGAGTALVFADDDGTWTQVATLASEPQSLQPVTGGEVACSDGEASLWTCERVDLVSFLPVSAIGGGRGIRLNDVWGWTDTQTGREYALVGRIDGLSIVDISNPTSPRYIGDLPMTPGSNAAAWRDMKVYDDHVFVVADGAGQHGMQVLDLRQLRAIDAADMPVTFEPTALYENIASAHNIVINEGSGYAYIVGARGGGETCGGGLHMVDIHDPEHPEFVGCFQDPSTGRAGTGYSHDAQCVMYEGPDQDYAGHEVCFGSNETALSIADVTDKAAATAISRAEYPNVGYTHQAWLTDDQRYLYMDDELDELQGKVENTRTLIWDVSDLDDPQLVKEYYGPTKSIDHNLYVKGNYVYESNYTSGLRILDISDPVNPHEVGFFDTVPYGGDRPVFDGSWSTYPYFDSGTIVITGGRLGVFFLRKQEPVS